MLTRSHVFGFGVVLLLTGVATAEQGTTARTVADGWTGPAVDAAAAKAGLKASDTLETKVRKALRLINDQAYFQPSAPAQKFPPPFDNPYHLDSLRTPEQILSQKIGGFCGSAALAVAALLARAGVPRSDMRIVAAVDDKDLAVICPKAGSPRVPRPKTGASGHVFVALETPHGRWKLINTVGGSNNYEQASWFAPEKLENMMRAGPVAVPEAAAHGSPYQTMTLFANWPLDEVPLHTFDQRLNLIASGKVDGNVCRYASPY